MQNTDLILQKKQYLKKFIPCEKHTLSFYFHDIPISFYSDSRNLIDDLKSYLPSKWITEKNETYFYTIYHRSLPIDFKNWEDESSSEILNEDNMIIQRDFACLHRGQGKITDVYFHHQISDGLHNFFRYFLAQKLIIINKAMLHCASIVENNKAYIFLGPSGAGKTTTTSLSRPRLILGDDMNLITVKDNTLYCSPGGVGGLYKPDVTIDKSFEVAGIYWLTQDVKHFLQENTQSEKLKMLFASIANISWDELTPSLTNTIWTLSQKVVELSNIQTLHFSKDKEFWSLITGK